MNKNQVAIQVVSESQALERPVGNDALSRRAVAPMHVRPDANEEQVLLAELRRADGVSKLPPSMVSSRKIETASEELDDGTQIELIEDPQNSARSLLAVYRNRQVNLTDEFEFGDQVFVPIPRNSNLLRHVRLPRGVKPYRDANSLVYEVQHLLNHLLDVSRDDRELLTLFILSTWLVERLAVAPYLALVGPPGSGKSTALSALSLLCRRPVLTADISSAAFYQLCDRLTPTLLIDEAATSGNSRELHHLLRASTSRGVTALRRSESFSTFGPKAVAWLDLPDDAALNSRCVIIPLRETRRRDLKRVTDSWIQKRAQAAQMACLRFRFEKLRSLELRRTKGEEQLHPRSHDLYEALALPVSELPEKREWLVERLSAIEQINRPALPETHAAALQAVFQIAHTVTGQALISEVAEIANRILASNGERIQVNARKAGTILTSLGITERKRTNRGSTLILSSSLVREIHDLVAAHGVGFPPGVSEHQWRSACGLCKGLPVN